MNIKDLVKLRGEQKIKDKIPKIKKRLRQLKYFLPLVIILVIILIFSAFFALKLLTKSVDDKIIKEEQSDVQRQKQELDALRQQANQQEFSQEDIANQGKELDKLRDQAKSSGLLSKEEMEKQAEELNNLRLESQ